MVYYSVLLKMTCVLAHLSQTINVAANLCYNLGTENSTHQFANVNKFFYSLLSINIKSLTENKLSLSLVLAQMFDVMALLKIEPIKQLQTYNFTFTGAKRGQLGTSESELRATQVT